MAKKLFQKGNKQGKGRPPIPPEEKELRKKIHRINLLILQNLYNELFTLTRKQIIEIIKDVNTPMMKLWLAKVFIKAINEGDHITFERVMERLIGKVPVKLVGDSDNPITITVQADLSKYPAQQIENKNNVIETIENKDEANDEKRADK